MYTVLVQGDPSKPDDPQVSALQICCHFSELYTVVTVGLVSTEALHDHVTAAMLKGRTMESCFYLRLVSILKPKLAKRIHSN